MARPDTEARLAVLEERQNISAAQVAIMTQGLQDMNARIIRLESRTEMTERLMWVIAVALVAQILGRIAAALNRRNGH